MRSSSAGLAAEQPRNYTRTDYDIKLWVTNKKKKKEFNSNLYHVLNDDPFPEKNLCGMEKN
jgi:hypothetical protein